MLIEIVFRTSPDLKNATLVSKMGDAGYELDVDNAGSITLALKSGGDNGAVSADVPVNDGAWHHVIAEVDRDDGVGTIYVDGVEVASDQLGLAPGASLLNTADVLVAKGADGRFFSGSIDFLRICQGTLADARTSIEELYDWEFDGPFLRDFAGSEPEGAGRDAGAFEYVEGAN
jgi:hypothetical protein